MTKHFLIPVCILVSLASFYTPAAHGANVYSLATSCDVVVVGTVSSSTETATNVSFDIAVQIVLKGTASSATVHVSHPWLRGGIGSNTNGPTTFTQTIEGMWCLQPGASTDWDVLELTGPDGTVHGLFLPAAATLPAAYQIQAALPDTLLFYIAAGVEAADANPATAIGAAGGAQASSLQIVANRFMGMSNPEFQLAGLAALLSLQPSAISSVSALWPSISGNPRRSFLVFAIRETFRDPAPSSVQELVQLASLSPELREAAIHALSSIHTKESLPFLAGLLTSSDPNEQARGVFGLSSFANACPAQTPANVVSMAYLQCSNQGTYSTPQTTANFASPGTPSGQVVTFWINWWNQNQASLQ
jgi:hypothetical protein